MLYWYAWFCRAQKVLQIWSCILKRRCLNSWAFLGLNHMKEISSFEVQYPLVMSERGLLQDFSAVCYARSVFFIGRCFVNIYVGRIQVNSGVIFKRLCTQLAQWYECCFFFLMGFAYNLLGLILSHRFKQYAEWKLDFAVDPIEFTKFY